MIERYLSKIIYTDLQVSFKTIRSWIECLERVCYLYRIYPYQSKMIKSLKKEPKVYLWNWSQVKEGGPKLENIVASHLLKFCHYLYDVKGFKTELRFLRDKEQREVDFSRNQGRSQNVKIAVLLNNFLKPQYIVYFL